jgi:hypothetical protein
MAPIRAKTKDPTATPTTAPTGMPGLLVVLLLLPFMPAAIVGEMNLVKVDVVPTKVWVGDMVAGVVM